MIEMTRSRLRSEPIAVFFLAHGGHPGWEKAFERFASSYAANRPGHLHRLYVIFKGFRDGPHQSRGRSILEALDHSPMFLENAGLDIGSYAIAARQVEEKYVCFINTKTEIRSEGWLDKLAKNLAVNGVGLVGANGSFETHHPVLPAFPRFPNLHIRSNVFLIRKAFFLEVTDDFTIKNKYDQWLFECGPRSLSRRILEKKLRIRIVGVDGIGYDPWQWPFCRIMRQSRTDNALIADDHYRRYLAMDPVEKEADEHRGWGKYKKWIHSWEIRFLVRKLMSGRADAGMTGPAVCFCGSGAPRDLCHDHEAVRNFIAAAEGRYSYGADGA